MVKTIRLNRAIPAERAQRSIKAYQWIKHGALIAPLLIGNAYAASNETHAFDLPAQPLSATLDVSA